MDALLAPVPIAAIGLLLLNDHVLKAAYGAGRFGVLTGKLSDFAGLAFFPLLLWTFFELVHNNKPFVPQRRILWACIIATGIVFSATKTLPIAAELYRWTWGAMQWPFRWWHVGASRVEPVRFLMDPTDLVALPALAVAAVVGHRRCRRA
jgi:hypothetical protein